LLGYEKQFAVAPNTDNYGHPYDFESITHYPGTTFSRNGRPTIQTLNSKYQKIIGQAKQLSQLVN